MNPQTQSLHQYLSRALLSGVTDFSINATRLPDGGMSIWIYPEGKDGGADNFGVWRDPFNEDLDIVAKPDAFKRNAVEQEEEEDSL